jgi:vitamin B12 transporter
MARMIRMVLSMVLLSAPGAAYAQEQKKLDPVVVTATKTETPAEQVGASVSVVTEEDFKTYHYETVEDALRTVPGVEIRRSGSVGKLSNISIRGANANQVQVLIDGVRVKSPMSGQVDLSDVSPELIDRIEVIRGAQSTLYGADAMGGVINIITKKGKGPISATVEGAAGNYDTLLGRASTTGAYKLLDYALSVSHLESNGQFRNDDSEKMAFNLRLGLTLPWDSALAFIYRYNRNDIGLPIKFISTNPPPLPIVPIIDVNNRLYSETSMMALTARTHPVSWWEPELRLGRYLNYLRSTELPDPAEQCPFPACEFPARTTVERREVELLNHFHIGKWSTSSVGLEYRDEKGVAQGSTPFEADSDTRSVFFQQQFRVLERLFMSAGFRVEDNSKYGTHTTERGSLAYLIRAWGTRLHGGAGSGFRAPTFNDLFFPNFSDPTLKPEESFSYDFGVDQKLWKDRIRLGLTYFQNEFTNLISFEFTNVAPFVKGVNVGRARSAGIEFVSEADLLDTLTASVNYTYTDSKNFKTDRPLAREPVHRWNIALNWRPHPRLDLFTQVHVVSEQFEPTGGANGVYNSGRTPVDVGGTWRIFERYEFIQSVDLFARIQNLLNEGYAEVRGFPALGINGLLGLRATFQ